MSSQQQQQAVKHSVPQGTNGADLILIGDAAFRNNNPSPAVKLTDNYGPMYNIEVSPKACKNMFRTDEEYISFAAKFGDYVVPNKVVEGNILTSGFYKYQVKTDNVPKRGLFNPYYRLTGDLKQQIGNMPNFSGSTSSGKPCIMTDRQFTTVSRPGNSININAWTANDLDKTAYAVSDLPSVVGGTNVVSHPSIAGSRPASSYGWQNGPAGSIFPNYDNDFAYDPDQELIGDVLSRLGEYTQNFVPAMPLAYVDCECREKQRGIPSRLARVYCSGSESFDDVDDDSEISLDVLMKTFRRYEDKGHSTMRHKAMMTLTHGYTPHDALSGEQLQQLLTFLKSSVPQVQDACLVLIVQCVSNMENLNQLIENNILHFLLDCIDQSCLFHLRISTLLLLEKIFLVSEYKDCWLEMAVTKFLPKLVSMLQVQMPLDVKYAVCCVFRALAQFEEFAVPVTDDILPNVLLLRNASAKFKEVYVEILTSLILHTDCIPPDIIDSSAIPITVSIVREGPCGPQGAALNLLSFLTHNDSGVAMVIGTSGLVPLVLCCMKDSHCRKVIQNATLIMRNICTCRKLGLCKDLMLQLSSYSLPSLDQESLTNLSQIATPSNITVPAKPRFDEGHHMWLGLDKFIDIIQKTIHREAKVETDELGIVTQIHMKPCVDVCPEQLELLTNTTQILQSMCLWPLDKSRLGFSANRVDLTTFTDDDKQRSRLSKVNRGVVKVIWDKLGMVVIDLLFTYVEKFTMVFPPDSKGERQFIDIESVFEHSEIMLIVSILELLLCFALCTCDAFPKIIPELKQSKHRSKVACKLKSSSTSQVITENKSSQSVELNLKSQSDTGAVFQSNADQIWVQENPHLTSLCHPSSQNAAAHKKSLAELQHKEICAERRLLRKCLYEGDVFRCVCPFFLCSDENIQVLTLQILRCLIQPLEERVTPKLSFTANGPANKNTRTRPQTAGAVQNANKKLNIALYRMSPEIASAIKDLLDKDSIQQGDASQQLEESVGKLNVKTKMVKKNSFNIPGNPNDLETIHERLNEYTETNRLTEVVREHHNSRLVRPMIDRCLPIAQQCRDALLLGLHNQLVNGIFVKSQVVKKHCLLILHDIVQSGEPKTHMQLSTFGCMPKLIDFLRVNEDNELLEIMGLIVVRMLVASDTRLKQLFNRHGGPQLLLAMAQYTKGLLKQEVSNTLKSMSKVVKPKRRPVSAPVMRTLDLERATDIWDHIQARWKQEDQVSQVLRQWIVDDHAHKKK